MGKVGWEKGWEQEEGKVSVKVRQRNQGDELIGVETRHRYKPLQLLTLGLSYRGSHENTHTHLVGQRSDTQTPDIQYVPPLYSVFLSLTHTQTCKNSEGSVLFRQASFPTVWMCV